MIALALTLLTALPFCPGYVVRGMEYDVCAHGPHPGLYVYTVSPPGIGYRVSLSTWLRSQLDTSMGDDERLGA